MPIQKDSAVERAIQAMGGVHKATLATGIPTETLKSYRRRGLIPRYEQCRIISDASGVPMDELAGYHPPSPSQRKTA